MKYNCIMTLQGPPPSCPSLLFESYLQPFFLSSFHTQLLSSLGIPHISASAQAGPRPHARKTFPQSLRNPAPPLMLSSKVNASVNLPFSACDNESALSQNSKGCWSKPPMSMNLPDSWHWLCVCVCVSPLITRTVSEDRNQVPLILPPSHTTSSSS